MTAKPGDYPARISKWLDRQGFPFELRVGKRIANAGWSVTHGHLFTDRASGKSRETDIIASLASSDQTLPVVRLSLIVECKVSSARPWVVFTAKGRPITPMLSSAFASGATATAALFELISARNKPEALSLLSSGGRRNHGIAAVDFATSRGRRRNMAYAAVRAAAAGATARSADQDDQYDAHKGSGRTAEDQVSGFTVYLPVVVVGGDLFEFSLNDDGSETLDSIDAAKVLAPSMNAPSGTSLVSVVTESGLGQLLVEGQKDFERLRLAYRNNPELMHVKLTKRVLQYVAEMRHGA